MMENTGKIWVNIPQPKRRKSPRAIRFAEIKVGDQLEKTTISISTWHQKGKEPWIENKKTQQYFIVTDLWFDPVAGQDNHVAGEMVGLAPFRQNGEVHTRKGTHTKRGLASQGFHYSKIDYPAMAKARLEAENVVGIGFANTLRKRPKFPKIPGL